MIDTANDDIANNYSVLVNRIMVKCYLSAVARSDPNTAISVLVQ